MEPKIENALLRAEREAEQKYGDLLRYTYDGPKTHPRMSAEARAAQFSPFAALTGYEEAVSETGRLTEEKPELDEERKAEIDRVLQFLAEKSRRGSREKEEIHIRLTYFRKDERKEGGALLEEAGVFRKIDAYRKRIFLRDAIPEGIALEDIMDLVVEEVEL